MTPSEPTPVLNARALVLALASQLDGPTAMYWIRLYGKGMHITLESVAANLPPQHLEGVINQLKLTIQRAKLKKFMHPN
jgi:hypothetical protein